MQADISAAAEPITASIDQLKGPLSWNYEDRQGGVYLALEDHDKIFNNLSNPPIIVNDVNTLSQEDKQKFNDLISTRYEGDSLSIVPSCDCGELSGGYNLGKVCGVCQTEVQQSTEKRIESTLWMKAPDGVHGFINPNVWLMFEKYFSSKQLCLVEWLCNPNLRYDNEKNESLNRLKRYNFKRGYNNFIENFDTIMNALYDIFAIHKRLEIQDFKTTMRKYRHCLFSQYVPVPSKVAFVTEKNDSTVTSDTQTSLAMDAIRTMSSIKQALRPLMPKQLENRTLKCVKQLAVYYEETYKTRLASKDGFIRKHMISGRLHYTARAVIVSLSEPHEYDELHLPWGLSVGLLRTHLTNKLLKLGYTPRAAACLLQESISRYHPLVDTLLNELIDESPCLSEIAEHELTVPKKKGLYVIIQRNPSLHRLSAQFMRVTKIIKDPSIQTISMSVLSLTGPNADFDGDALNILLITDKEMMRKMYRLSPHYGILSLQEPSKVSGCVGMPKPVVSTIDNWLKKGPKVPA
tara:strand:- start:1065 stop:2624 length:1560 start_codon:yes stop_codon:yes gene_type:complete